MRTLAQDAMEALERRRLREYGLKTGNRRFGLGLHSPALGLAGKLDLVIETADAVYPVDFKYTTGRPHRNHRMQLAGYALLLADRFAKTVPAVFIFLIPEDVTLRFAMTEAMLTETRAALTAM